MGTDRQAGLAPDGGYEFSPTDAKLPGRPRKDGTIVRNIILPRVSAHFLIAPKLTDDLDAIEERGGLLHKGRTPIEGISGNTGYSEVRMRLSAFAWLE
jgi:hypothetical protein